MKKIYILLFLSFIYLIINSFIIESTNFANFDLKSLHPNDYKNGKKRIAFIVGVANYIKIKQQLPNDNNDVDSMSQVLKELDFEVITAKDATLADYTTQKNIFISKLNTGHYEVCLFFFSGHGAEWHEINYLLPKDFIPIQDTVYTKKLDNYSAHAITLHNLLNEINDARVKIKLSFIDACRVDPSKTKDENNDPYLQEAFRASEIIENKNYIFFATTSHETSSTGENYGLVNSVFTHCILKHIRENIDFPYFIDKVTTTSSQSYNQNAYPKGRPPVNFSFTNIKVDTKAENYFRKGNEYYLDKDYDNAIKKYDQAINENPNHISALMNRGSAKYEINDLFGSIEDFSKVVELDPNYAKAYFNLGNSKMDLKDYKGAIKAFSKDLELSPNDVDAYYNIGLVRYYQGEAKLAIKQFSKAIELSPNDGELYNARGMAKMKKGDLFGACKDFKMSSIKGYSAGRNSYNNNCN